jgi:hypothetical protein
MERRNDRIVQWVNISSEAVKEIEGAFCAKTRVCGRGEEVGGQR